jgi:hypothetical protein
VLFQFSKRAAGEAAKFGRSGVELLGVVCAALLESGEPAAEAGECGFGKVGLSRLVELTASRGPHPRRRPLHDAVGRGANSDFAAETHDRMNEALSRATRSPRNLNEGTWLGVVYGFGQTSQKGTYKTMRIQPTMTTVPLLAMMLVGPVIEATGEPSPHVRAPVTAKSSRADLAQLQAPVGHRQPTQNDIPPSVREQEAPSAEANPQQDSQGGSGDGQRARLKEQRRTPNVQPNGVPRICDPGGSGSCSRRAARPTIQATRLKHQGTPITMAK